MAQLSEISFQVTTDLTTVASTQIETNFEAVKQWLTEELAPYATMVVTPDAIGDAKKTRAQIRKVGDGIDSQRKAIKKVWMKPFEEYESKCKELTGIVSEAVSNIDGQIKAMENAEKQAKRERLEAFFIEHSEDIAEYITFDAIFDSKWLNATFSEIDAANSIEEKLQDTREALAAIRDMGSPYESVMLSEFGRSHSLAKAIAEAKRLEAIQKAEEERKARQDAIRAQETETGIVERPKEENGSDEATELYSGISTGEQFIRPVIGDEPRKPKTHLLRLEFEVTVDHAVAMKRFFNDLGIKYKKI